MTYLENEKLDCMIKLAFLELPDDDVKEFLALDDSNVVLSDRLNKRVARLIKKQEAKEKAVPVKRWTIRLMVAAILLLSVLIGTMLSITAIRETIWNTIVSWYDEYIAVNFVQEVANSDGKNASSSDNLNLTEEAPLLTYIETYKKPHLNESYEEVENKGKILYTIDYYKDGSFCFSYNQKPLTQKEQYYDNDSINMEKVKVNKFDGIVVVADNENYLFFSDGSYIYNISGAIGKDELVIIAETIY